MTPSYLFASHTVNVLRPRSVHDASGSNKQTFTLVTGLSDIPASIQAYHGNAERKLGQRQVIISHHIFLFSNINAQRGDILQSPQTGLSYLVHGIEDQGGRGRVWLFECTVTS